MDEDMTRVDLYCKGGVIEISDSKVSCLLQNSILGILGS